MENKDLENEIPEETITKISEILNEIKTAQNSNEVHPQKIYELYYRCL